MEIRGFDIRLFLPNTLPTNVGWLATPAVVCCLFPTVTAELRVPTMSEENRLVWVSYTEALPEPAFCRRVKVKIVELIRGAKFHEYDTITKLEGFLRINTGHGMKSGHLQLPNRAWKERFFAKNPPDFAIHDACFGGPHLASLKFQFRETSYPFSFVGDIGECWAFDAVQTGEANDVVYPLVGDCVTLSLIKALKLSDFASDFAVSAFRDVYNSLDYTYLNEKRAAGGLTEKKPELVDENIEVLVSAMCRLPRDITIFNELIAFDEAYVWRPTNVRLNYSPAMLKSILEEVRTLIGRHRANETGYTEDDDHDDAIWTLMEIRHGFGVEDVYMAATSKFLTFEQFAALWNEAEAQAVAKYRDQDEAPHAAIGA